MPNKFLSFDGNIVFHILAVIRMKIYKQNADEELRVVIQFQFVWFIFFSIKEWTAIRNLCSNNCFLISKFFPYRDNLSARIRWSVTLRAIAAGLLPTPPTVTYFQLLYNPSLRRVNATHNWAQHVAFPGLNNALTVRASASSSWSCTTHIRTGHETSSGNPSGLLFACSLVYTAPFLYSHKPSPRSIYAYSTIR